MPFFLLEPSLVGSRNLFKFLQKGFSICCREPYYRQIQKEVRMFRKADDWKKEMMRTKCENWRLSDININFTISPKLPEYIVVPTSVTNDVLSRAVEHFQNRCCPLWVCASSIVVQQLLNSIFFVGVELRRCRTSQNGRFVTNDNG